MVDYRYQSLSLLCTDKDIFDIPCPDARLFCFSGGFTLELWIKVPVFQTDKVLLQQKNNFSLWLSDKKIVFSYAGGTDVIVEDAELYENTWHSIVVIVYENDIRLLVDNVLCKEALLADNKSSTEPLTICGGFFGNVRWVRVYSDALMVSEVPEYVYSAAMTENMAIYCDFTSSPPRERVTGKEIPLKGNAKIVRSMPAAAFGEGKYFLSRERGMVNPAGRNLDEYSIQAWCLPEAPSGSMYYTVFSNSGENTDAGVEIALLKKEDSEKYKVSVIHKSFNATDNTLTSVSDVEKGSWYNLAVTFDGDVLTLYINGRLDSRKDGLKTLGGMLAKNNLTIGARFNHGIEADYFHGFISRIDVWEKCLSNSEVSAYMDADPDYEEEKIAAVWRFFDSIHVNMVTDRQLLGVGDIASSTYEAPVSGNCREIHKPYGLTVDEVEPLTAAELDACRRESGILSTDAECGTMTSVFEKEGKLYIVIHTRESSFTATMLDADTAEWDELTVWIIELVVLILNAAAMYVFSKNITYTRTLGGRIYTRLIENSGQFMTIIGALDAAATAKSAAAVAASILSMMVSKGILRELFKTAIRLSFWDLITGIAFLALKLLNPPGSFAVMLAMLAASILAHLAKLPRLLCKIQVNEIYFIHNQQGAIGGINIRKNETENWFTPEWAAGRRGQAPVAYRISRFNGDPLKIKVNFTRSNVSRFDTVRIRGLAYGQDSDYLGDTSLETVTFPPGRTKSNDVFFTLANHRIQANGIQKKEIRWAWEYSEAGQGNWVQGTHTEHTVYAILSDVHEPWGRATAVNPKIDLPWTDVYDWTIDTVRGESVPGAVAKKLAAAMFRDSRYLYNRDDYIYTMHEGGGLALTLQVLMDHYHCTEKHGRVRIECLDCAAILAAQANIYGCNLRMLIFNPRDHKALKLRSLWAIGEDVQRPAGNTFDYHCAVTDSGNVADLTQVNVYDSCISYYSALTGNLILADGVRCAQSPTLPPGGYPALTQEAYVAGWLLNDNTGIGNTEHPATETVFLGEDKPWKRGALEE